MCFVAVRGVIEIKLLIARQELLVIMHLDIICGLVAHNHVESLLVVLWLQ